MSAPIAPPKLYTPPGYVTAFRLAGLVCVVLGLVAIVVALNEGVFPTAAVGCILAAGINFLYADLAEAVARTEWRVATLAYQLQPVIDEVNYQADERERAERTARLAQEAEIQRVLQEREAAQG